MEEQSSGINLQSFKKETFLNPVTIHRVFHM